MPDRQFSWSFGIANHLSVGKSPVIYIFYCHCQNCFHLTALFVQTIWHTVFSAVQITWFSFIFSQNTIFLCCPDQTLWWVMQGHGKHGSGGRKKMNAAGVLSIKLNLSFSEGLKCLGYCSSPKTLLQSDD